MEMLYYSFLLIVASVLQETREGFLTSFSIGFITIIAKPALMFLTSQGVGFFYALLIIDLIYLIPCLYYKDCKVSRICAGIICTSILLNCSYILMSDSMYELLSPYYRLATTLIFEGLVFACFQQSTILKFLKFMFKPAIDFCRQYNEAVEYNRRNRR